MVIWRITYICKSTFSILRKTKMLAVSMVSGFGLLALFCVFGVFFVLLLEGAGSQAAAVAVHLSQISSSLKTLSAVPWLLDCSFHLTCSGTKP